MSKSDAKKRIEAFFTKDSFTNEEARKIKRLAMHHKIRLGKQRSRFCKKCNADLKNGKVRIGKGYKIITCSCGFRNKVEME